MVVRKMKEKCKDAARMRREKERAEFVELSKLLPLPSNTTSQLDKASIIRLTSSYLRMRAAFPEGLGSNWGRTQPSAPAAAVQLEQQQQQQQQQQNQVKELGSLLLQTLDGFVFALHKDGKIMYISETASVHLGLPQIDLTGSSVFEYVHPSDHQDIYEALALAEPERAQLEAKKAAANGGELARSFCMRMKCILPKRNAGLVSSGYKSIHCTGYLKVGRRSERPAGPNQPESADEWESHALVAVGHSLLPSASTEVKLGGHSFMFRANLDLKIYYIEAAASQLLGFEQQEMVGHSLYQFVHAADALNLESSHRALLEKGQTVTRYFRLMRQTGGSVWVQSYATLVSNPRNMPKPQHVVSFCLVLGENRLDQSCSLRAREPPLPAHAAEVGQPTALRGQCSPPTPPALRVQTHRLHAKKERHSAQRKARRGARGLSQPALVLGLDSPAERLAGPFGQCTCLLSAGATNTIGPIRRSSDDTCSIVSSVASASISSSSSSHQTTDFLSYMTADGYPSHHDHLHSAPLIQPLHTDSPLDTTVDRLTTTQIVVGQSASYDEFGEQMPLGPASLRAANDSCSQAWLTVAGPCERPLADEAAGPFCGQLGYQSAHPHYIQTPTDWLSRSSCPSTVFEQPTQQVVGLYPCVEERRASYSDGSHIGTHYHRSSPPYAANDSSTIYQSVAVNNSYTM